MSISTPQSTGELAAAHATGARRDEQPVLPPGSAEARRWEARRQRLASALRADSERATRDDPKAGALTPGAGRPEPEPSCALWATSVRAVTRARCGAEDAELVHHGASRGHVELKIKVTA